MVKGWQVYAWVGKLGWSLAAVILHFCSGQNFFAYGQNDSGRQPTRSMTAQAQDQNQKLVQDMMMRLHQSHIEGNTPPGKLFDQYLKRDLNYHYGNVYAKKVSCEYSLMQKQAIQFGVGYPYYYLWVKIFDDHGALIEEGFTSAKAMDKTMFEIGKFIRPSQINTFGFTYPEFFPDELIQNVRKEARRAGR